MRAATSCASRWNWRSAPVRSIRTGMPRYLASKPRATRSDTGRSMAAYQTTLPSFFAASISAGVTAVGSGACALTCACAGCMNLPAPGDATTLATVIAADLLSRSRRESFPLAMATSHPKDLRVPRLYFLGHLLDPLRVLLHQLDVGELADARLLLREGVGRVLAREIDENLLSLEPVQPVVEQASGVRIGRALEQRARARRQWRAFARIDDLDRLPLLLGLNDEVTRAVDHHGALAERDLLGRVGRRLHLHDALLGELLEVFPAELARGLERRVHDGAAIGGMGLDHLARPFRIEQIGEAFWRLLRLHQPRIVAERGDQNARRHMQGVRIVIGLVEMLGDLFGQVGREPAVALPDDAVRLIGGIDHVDRANVALVLLVNALEDALGAGALDAHGDAG